MPGNAPRRYTRYTKSLAYSLKTLGTWKTNLHLHSPVLTAAHMSWEASAAQNGVCDSPRSIYAMRSFSCHDQMRRVLIHAVNLMTRKRLHVYYCTNVKPWRLHHHVCPHILMILPLICYWSIVLSRHYIISVSLIGYKCHTNTCLHVTLHTLILNLEKDRWMLGVIQQPEGVHGMT